MARIQKKKPVKVRSKDILNLRKGWGKSKIRKITIGSASAIITLAPSIALACRSKP